MSQPRRLRILTRLPRCSHPRQLRRRSRSRREEESGRYLIALEQTASEPVERIIPIDPLAPPTLIVEVVRPDERAGWILRTVTESFSLASVTSITLEDVED
jgi:hypothetical protein